MENVLNAVDDAQTPVVEVSHGESDESGSSEQTADLTHRPQTREENAGFRKMRLENDRLRAENEHYLSAVIQRQMAEDLQKIRQMAPEVTSLEELGEEFANLVAQGISAPVAFAAVRQTQKATLPPTMGAVEEHSRGEKEFYLPDEVDTLTEKELSDPKIWARVRASMTKW